MKSLVTEFRMQSNAFFGARLLYKSCSAGKPSIETEATSDVTAIILVTTRLVPSLILCEAAVDDRADW